MKVAAATADMTGRRHVLPLFDNWTSWTVMPGRIVGTPRGERLGNTEVVHDPDINARSSARQLRYWW